MAKNLLLIVLFIKALPVFSQQITIIDIGHLDRVQLASEIKIISKYSPKIIGLDFYLYKDSLEKDSALVNVFSEINNSVFGTALLNYNLSTQTWDSIKSSNTKFKRKYEGYTNVYFENEKIIPIHSLYEIADNELIYSFAYEVARASGEIKKEYLDVNSPYMRIKFYPKNKAYKIIKYDELLSGNFNKKLIKNKIVLLGYIGQDEDWFYIDSNHHVKINGIEYHAQVIYNLIK